MAKKKSASKTPPAPTPVLVNTTRGVGYFDWLFLHTAKGAHFREKYLKLKDLGLVQESGAPFVAPTSARDSYFGTSLFRNKRAMLHRA